MGLNDQVLSAHSEKPSVWVPALALFTPTWVRRYTPMSGMRKRRKCGWLWHLSQRQQHCKSDGCLTLCCGTRKLSRYTGLCCLLGKSKSMVQESAVAMVYLGRFDEAWNI